MGAAVSRELARAGCAVIVHAHRQLERAEALCDEIRGAGGVAEAFGCDLGDAGATEVALGPVLAGGAVQVVVHNAGSHDDVPMAGMSLAQWRGPIESSLTGFYSVLRPLLLPMMGTRWGRVVAVSSVSAIVGNRGQVAYAAAKAGLVGAVRSLAKEVATRGITVNAVLPGIIASPAVDAVMDAKRIAEVVPMRRAGTAEEVAALIGFLSGDRAGYITGQAISINGGMA